MSGNGKGNRNLVDEDAEWITLDTTDANFGAYTKNLYKDDNRKDFLSQYSPEILYTWKLFGMNDLRQSVLATMDGKQVATVESVPATEVTALHRKRMSDTHVASELISSLNIK